MKSFKIGQVTKIEQAISNKIYLNPRDYKLYLESNNNVTPIYVNIKDVIFTIESSKDIEEGYVGLNKKQREFLKLSTVMDTVRVELFVLPKTEYRLSLLKIEITPIKLDFEKELEDTAFDKLFKSIYAGQFFSTNQEVYFQLEGINFFGKVVQLMLMDSNIKKEDLNYGMLGADTDLEFTTRGSSNFRIKNQSNKLKTIFRPDFKFEDMGVGGLDREIQDIFRRAFSSRRIPNHLLGMFGIKHVKGLLLYGPPGTGKTLIARQLAKVLHAKEPKIVNGPELFNKYVGETENNMRKLFAEAKADQANLREDSPLHIIIFDEFDALAKHRGSDTGGTGVADNIVNQLLSIIDGVESLDNILVIGMTNRLDLIDKAVLRPGRFEVHVEIGLPDEQGRSQILNIHTKTMRDNKLLGKDIDLNSLAARLKNYTGAEIEAVVKSASSFALNRNHKLMDFTKQLKIENPGKIEMVDFENAMEEVKPEFGVESGKLDVYTREPLVMYGVRMKNILSDSKRILQEVATNKVSIASLLLYGSHGTGKTSIAARLGMESSFPFVKIVTAEDLIGKSEFFKVNYIVKCFEDAYKSKQSLIILDDLERLIEYVDIGRRFSNNILQAILVLIKRLPSKPNHSICILATSSNLDFLKEFGIYSQFNIKIEVPEITFKYKDDNEIANVFKQKLSTDIKGSMGQKPTFRIPIKKLLFIINMFSNIEGRTIDDKFIEGLRIIGNENNDDDEMTKWSFK